MYLKKWTSKPILNISFFETCLKKHVNSPLLFNLVGDVLTRMLMKGANMGLIRGLGFDFRDGGVISLQYADDTILFSDID